MGTLIKQDLGVLGGVPTVKCAIKLLLSLGQLNRPVQVASANMLAAVVAVFRDAEAPETLRRAGIQDRDTEMIRVSQAGYLWTLQEALTSQFPDVVTAARGVCMVLKDCSLFHGEMEKHDANNYSNLMVSCIPLQLACVFSTLTGAFSSCPVNPERCALLQPKLGTVSSGQEGACVRLCPSPLASLSLMAGVVYQPRIQLHAARIPFSFRLPKLSQVSNLHKGYVQRI